MVCSSSALGLFAAVDRFSLRYSEVTRSGSLTDSVTPDRPSWGSCGAPPRAPPALPGTHPASARD
eukprot:CAMPEP_0204310824 /NCGR_PEP_ID=MMETSP0469-20131031/1965_1 /ASSEMBLY_ACC=CAM_ASM_000384 /TAXON_ID=2969 /ORGANISM="Oxyrrhis marina" /LENGTH=64 /DNA_ID=CAMNT_0051290669 /DNA_START=198 /DNA_END=389 /DNA_ORIENTATION=-